MLTESEAIEIQLSLREKVVAEDAFASPVKVIAGVDVEYDKDTDLVAGAVVLLDAGNHSLLETATHTMRAPFPYIPSLFSFREMPPLVAAYKKLRRKPDVIVCDGQGIAHPRGFGLACHLGIELDTATIGCAKSLLVGSHDEVGSVRGSQENIIADGKALGVALRTQTDVRCVYVSVGHKISLPTACRIVLSMTPKYRLPETTRLADRYAREILVRQKTQLP